MTPILLGVALLLGCAAAALLLRRHPPLAGASGVIGPACMLALTAGPALSTLTGGPELAASLEWMAPFGRLALGVDSLSGLFLLVILTVATLAALYGLGYLHRTPRDAASWFFFDLLVASMVTVVIARHVLLFLLAWETMALSSFFLVAHERDERSVRRAAWVYLIATHLGSLFLLPMFFLLAPPGGSLAFADLGAASTPAVASVCFVLGVIGFGCKAGLMPLHVWLPEAHPAAPSHVSALLSAVMIKTGIYGLLRLLTWLHEPPLWWGFLLLLLGTASALLGILLSLAQHNLKRLLAYSTVENVGIITCAIGVGVCGIALDSPALGVLGFGGALFHVVNHAFFKGLAFLGAGSVLRATGTAEMDTLGGLQRRMPWTAGGFLVGMIALAGLPPLNGFASELVIYLGTFWAATRQPALGAVPLGLAGAALATVGALALAGVAKVYGVAFLGAPRSECAEKARESPLSMRLAMLALAGLCVAAGAASPWVFPIVLEAARPLSPGRDPATAFLATSALARVNAISLLILALVVALALIRLALLRGREVRRQPTWDCGYLAASPSMQYTASSFTQPVIELFSWLLGTRTRLSSPEIHFPDAAHLETETPDLSREGIYEPLFETAGGALRRIQILQHGRLHVYVLGVVVTLLALLLWQVN